MKDIKDFEGLYQACENGDIFCKGRWNNGGKMKQSSSGNGYLKVSLFKNGKYTTRNVHRLIAETFIPNPNNLPQVNHINGDKTDNRVKNLEWCTSDFNMQHAVDTGLLNVKGVLNHNNKLSETQIREIRALQGKMLGTEIAKLYGVSKTLIYNIFNNSTWKHV